MSDAEYILRLIIRARDEFAGVFLKAREEIKRLRGDVNDAVGDFDKLNSKISGLSLRLKNLTGRVDEARGKLRELAQGTKADFDKLDSSIDKVTETVTKNSKAAKAAVQEGKSMEEEFDRLTDAAHNLNQEFRRGERDQDSYVAGMKRVAQESRNMVKRFDIGDEIGDMFGQISRDAEAAANKVVKAEEEAGKQRIALEKRVAAERERIEKAAAQKLEQDAKRAQQESQARAAADSQARRRQLEANRREQERTNVATKRANDAERERNETTQHLLRTFNQYNAALGRKGQLDARELATLRKLSTQMQQASRDHEIGTRDFHALADAQGAISDRMRIHNEILRENSRRTRIVEDDHNRLARAFGAMTQRISNTGDSVAKLDNQFRGLLILGVLVFAQQLLSVLTALGGELVAVAGSAAMAGAGIAGGLTAAAAQALPVIGLLAASLHRLSAIGDALQKADMVRMQTAQRADKQAEQGTSTSNQLANAQDGLRSALDSLGDAHDRVREARLNLNDAIREGRLEIEDLILAERRQELAARGAALSQDEALRALRSSVSGGDVTGLQRAEIGVADANLGRQAAGTQLSRARTAATRARTQGVGGLDSVQQARKQLEDARDGVIQAERAVARARRGLDEAGASASKATEGYFAAASQLNYLLEQLSPAERRLFESVQRIQKVYRENFRPITDIIIGSFERGVNKATELLKRRDILAAAASLAEGVAAQIDKIREAFTSDEAIRQFLRIVAQAKENLEPLGDIFVTFGKIFLNVAEAAGPALATFLGYIGRLADRFLGLTSNRDKLEGFFNTAEQHLESWINLTIAVIQLFAAITGQGGAEAGKRGIDDLTASIDTMTAGVNRNGEKVKQFFTDARRGTEAVISVVVKLATEIFKSFNPNSVETFARMLNQTVIPALGQAIRFTGGLIEFVSWFFENPIFGPFLVAMAKFLVTALLVTKVTTGIAGAVGLMAGQFEHFFRIMGPLATPLRTLSTLGTRVGILGLRMQETNRFGAVFGRMFERIGGRIEAVTGSLRRLAQRIPILRRFATESAAAGVAPGVVAGTGAGAAAAGGAAAGQAAQRSRGRRVARGAGIAGLVGIGAGVAATGGQLDNEQIRRFGASGDLGGSLQAFSSSVRQAGGSALSFDIGGTLRGLRNMFGLGGLLGGKSTEDLRKFGETADAALRKMAKANDVKGMQRLAEQARDLARDFPDASEALGKFEEQARTASERSAKLRDIMKAFGSAADLIKRGRIRAEDVVDPKGVEALYNSMHRLATAGTSDIETFRTNLRLLTRGINQDFVKGSQSWAVAMSDGMTAGIKGIIKNIGNGKIEVGEGMREIRSITRRQMALMRDNMDSMSWEGKEALASNFRSARIAIERQTGGWRKATETELREIRRLMRAELELYGLSPEQARRLARNRTTRGREDVDQGGRNDRAAREGTGGGATGGIFGMVGNRGRDVIPALVGSGEMLLNNFHQKYIDPAVQAFYGHPLADTFRRIRGFHAGGYGDSPPQIGWKGFAGGYAGRTPSGGRAVGIPGFPGEFINASVLREALALVRRFKLFVTDAFATSGHVGAGHLKSGTAMDVVPGPGGSWDTVDRAVAFARSKGLTVLYNGVPNHGRGHHAHIELAKGALGAVGAAIRGIRRVVLGGADSRLRDIGQTGLDNVRDAANRMLRRAVLASGAEGTEDVKAMDADANVVSAFRRAIRTKGSNTTESLALWMAGIVESGLRNLTYGDADSLGSLQERVSIYGRGHALNPFASAIRFLSQAEALRPWRGSPGHLAQAVQRSAFPERYDAVRSRAARYMRFGAGGVVPGGDGQPLNVIAHGKEWILNKLQQSRLANLIGTSREALRSMLGFHGQGGEAGYQGGGEVEDADVNPLFTTKGQRLRLSNIAKGIYELSVIPIRDWEGLMREAVRVFRAISNTGKRLGRRISDLNRLAEEGGILDQMDTQRERMVAAFNTKLTLATYKFRRKAGQIIRDPSMTALVAADQQLDIAEKSLRAVLGQEGVVTKALRQVNKRIAAIREDGVTRGEAGRFRELLTLRTNLQDRRTGLAGTRAENLESLFQARVARQQAAVEAINARYGRESAVQDLLGRQAQAVGSDIVMDKVNAARRSIWERQAAELERRIGWASQVGNTELADQLATQVEDLRMQIFESLQQDVQASFDRIQTTFQRRDTARDLSGRLADVMERFGSAFGGADPLGAARRRQELAESRGRDLGEQRQQLQALLNAQLALPANQQNITVMQALNDAIAELDVAVVENTAQQAELTVATRQVSIDLITNRQNFQGGVLSSLVGILQGIGEQGDATTTDQLSTTQKMRDLLMQTAEGLREQLRDIFGIDVGALHGIDFVNFIQSLNFDQLTAAMSDPDKQQFEALINAIIENEAALVDNTNSINELAGTVKEPQQFSTTAWQWFRTAIFNGLGMPLPQYEVPAAYGGPVLAKTNGSVNFTAAGGAGAQNKTVNQDIDINYHEVNEAPSALETANRVSWLAKTANTEE